MCGPTACHFNVRLAEERLCTLVIIGVRTDGTKELVAVADGLRESTESWAELLRDLRRGGMQAPVLAVGDVPLGCGRRYVIRSLPPEPTVAGATRLPCAGRPAKGVHAGARRALAEITGAEDREHAEQAVAQFEQHWRAVNGSHLVALVRAGAVFRKGVLIARPGRIRKPPHDHPGAGIHNS
jgi:Transposase, Mutator family